MSHQVIGAEFLQHQFLISLLKSSGSCSIEDIISMWAALTNLTDSDIPFD